ncbi:MAG: hypothetical protein ACI4TB_00715, partial [Lachnospiraceae bacterium]
MGSAEKHFPIFRPSECTFCFSMTMEQVQKNCLKLLRHIDKLFNLGYYKSPPPKTAMFGWNKTKKYLK